FSLNADADGSWRADAGEPVIDERLVADARAAITVVAAVPSAPPRAHHRALAVVGRVATRLAERIGRGLRRGIAFEEVVPDVRVPLTAGRAWLVGDGVAVDVGAADGHARAPGGRHDGRIARRPCHDGYVRRTAPVGAGGLHAVRERLRERTGVEAR